jgi:phosphoglycolate phosphatase
MAVGATDARRKGFRVYLFDFDGTIAATRPAARACLVRAVQEHGTTVGEADADAVIGSGAPLDAAIAALAPGFTGAEIAACVARYRALYPDIDREMTTLYDGVRETSAALHGDGRAVVVMSNKGRAALEAALARFGLLDKMRAVLADDPGVPLKPDPQAFHRRVRPLFCDPALSGFLMVGDTAADIAFAKAAGIASCWVSYGYGDADRCLSMKPDFIAQALTDLLSTDFSPAQDTGNAAPEPLPG